jgi:hypothetical protein
MKKLLSFLFFWLWTGFAGGGFVLLLLAIPVENALKATAMEQSRINLIMSLMALGWILLSAMIAWTLNIVLKRSLFAAHTAGLLICVIIFCVFEKAGKGYFAYFRAEKVTISDRFTFGPCPDVEDMEGLKAEGYTGVISLLSPMVPFEATLLKTERENAAKCNFLLVEAPMLPWVSANEESLAKIREIAKSGKGKYYLHCYLGKHRVELARSIILEATDIKSTVVRISLPETFRGGRIFKFGENLAIGPLPEDFEWFDYTIRAGTRQVISVLNPRNLTELSLIAAERKSAIESGIEFVLFPVTNYGDAAHLARMLATNDQRVYVNAEKNDARMAWLKHALESRPTAKQSGAPVNAATQPK